MINHPQALTDIHIQYRYIGVHMDILVHYTIEIFNIFWKPVFSKKNLFKQILTTPFIYVFISLFVNKSLYIYTYILFSLCKSQPFSLLLLLLYNTLKHIIQKLLTNIIFFAKIELQIVFFK